MDKVELENKVKAVIQNQLAVDADSIKDESDLFSDFNADSLDVVELIMAIEEEFCIALPEEECNNISTVRSLIESVEKHIKDLC